MFGKNSSKVWSFLVLLFIFGFSNLSAQSINLEARDTKFTSALETKLEVKPIVSSGSVNLKGKSLMYTIGVEPGAVAVPRVESIVSWAYSTSLEFCGGSGVSNISNVFAIRVDFSSSVDLYATPEGLKNGQNQLISSGVVNLSIFQMDRKYNDSSYATLYDLYNVTKDAAMLAGGWATMPTTGTRSIRIVETAQLHTSGNFMHCTEYGDGNVDLSKIKLLGSDTNLKVRFRDGVPASFPNQTNIRAILHNTGSSNISLSQGDYLRYYFKILPDQEPCSDWDSGDGNCSKDWNRKNPVDSMQFDFYWGQYFSTPEVAIENCQGDYWSVKIPLSKNFIVEPNRVYDEYYELNGDLRANHPSWPRYIKENDYSYVGTNTFVNNSKIAAFRANGSLISGAPPYDCGSDQYPSPAEVYSRTNSGGVPSHLILQDIILNHSFGTPSPAQYYRYYLRYERKNENYLEFSQSMGMVTNIDTCEGPEMNDVQYLSFKSLVNPYIPSGEQIGLVHIIARENDGINDLFTFNKLNDPSYPKERLSVLELHLDSVYFPYKSAFYTRDFRTDRPGATEDAIRLSIFAKNDSIAFFDSNKQLIAGNTPGWVCDENEKIQKIEICEDVTLTAATGINLSISQYSMTTDYEEQVVKFTLDPGYRADHPEFTGSGAVSLNADSLDIVISCGATIHLPSVFIGIDTLDIIPVDSTILESCDSTSTDSSHISVLGFSNSTDSLFMSLLISNVADGTEKDFNIYLNYLTGGSAQGSYDKRIHFSYFRPTATDSLGLSFEYPSDPNLGQWTRDSITDSLTFYSNFGYNQIGTIGGEGLFVEIAIPWSTGNFVNYWIEGADGWFAKPDSALTYNRKSVPATVTMDGNSCDWSSLGCVDCSFPLWVGGLQSYSKGDKVFADDNGNINVYEAQINMGNWETPIGAGPSRWLLNSELSNVCHYDPVIVEVVEVEVSCSGISECVAGTAYVPPAKCTEAGSLYSANWWVDKLPSNDDIDAWNLEGVCQ
ncbi:hypothetical protein OAA91_00945 [Fibrobacterales bacterium]|nr:hypothetical protein [Fibrobacterales bacterium]